MEYRPSPSVTTLRVFSMRTGLAASTVTPGKTAPDESFTTPAMVLCADAAAGRSVSSARPIQKRANVNPRIVFSFVGTEEWGSAARLVRRPLPHIVVSRGARCKLNHFDYSILKNK